MNIAAPIAPRTIDFKAAARKLLPPGASYDACLSCGLCSASTLP